MLTLIDQNIGGEIVSMAGNTVTVRGVALSG